MEPFERFTKLSTDTIQIFQDAKLKLSENILTGTKAQSSCIFQNSIFSELAESNDVNQVKSVENHITYLIAVLNGHL